MLHVDSSLVRSPLTSTSEYTLLKPSCWNVGHVVPEALVGGPIGLVKDGDKITIDANERTITWHVDEEEQARRKAEWDAVGPREFREKRGILYKYARDVAVSIFFRR